MKDKKCITEEVNNRIIELDVMFDLAYEINKKYNESHSWNDISMEDMLKLSTMVETYIPNISKTLSNLYD